MYFKEQWSDFNGDGYALSKLKFEKSDFEEIMNQTMAKGYKRLPIDTIPASDGIIDSLFRNHRTGYFVVKRLKNEISVTIIDTKAEAMVTYTTIF